MAADKNEHVERAEADAERAREASRRAEAAKTIAEDLAQEAEYEAKNAPGDDAVRAAAKEARAAADQSAEAWHRAREAANRAADALKRVEKGSPDEAAAFARDVREAADEAEREARDAERAAGKSRRAELAADEAALAAEGRRGRDEEPKWEKKAKHHADDEHAPPRPTGEKRPALLLARYDSPEGVVHAAEKVRDAGYEIWDVHTPYPVHGMDQAMGLSSTKMGIISFVAGITGLVSAILMIQYMNNWDYPIVVGGKPPGAFPSMVPIMFELAILLTGFGTFFGLLGLCKLPRHHHPVFYSDAFEGATDDKFFISIEAADRKFDIARTRALLESTHPTLIELVEEEVV